MTKEQSLVITVTLNAAVDKTYTVSDFGLDRIHRPSAERSVAGGKGINVARVLTTLKQPALASGFIGGHNGGLIQDSLNRENIRNDFVHTRGESRICIAVVDPVNRTQTEVNENGPEVNAEEVDAMHRKIESLLPLASYIAFSGSAPPGVPSDFYARAITSAKAAGVVTVLDTSGEHFRAGVEAQPFMVKPNAVELSAYMGSELYTVEELIEGARKLAASGISLVVVSMGKSGALVVDGSSIWQAVPPEIEFASAVGSGDSLVAAFVDALIRGCDVSDALVAGTAAGAANAMIYGAGFCSLESIEAVKSQVTLVRLG